MALALICSQADLDAELEGTPLGRAEVERQVAARRDQARILALAARPDVVVVDRELPEAEELVADLRQADATRALSIAVVARGDFEPLEVALLQAGANAILRLPPGPEWSERLPPLMSVPPRTRARVPVSFRVVAFALPERTVPAVALNLSVSGMLLESEEAVGLGDELDLSFALPPEEAALRPRAEVGRLATPRQCGVRFVALSPADRARVQRYVESSSDS
jgi:CheY-like chemotaxis protein